MQELSWTREKLVQCLDLFSLAPRDGYWEPPSQSRREDLYPWRFNREVSYLRRPLLVRERNNKTELLWGHRHLDIARFYLVELCQSTRLKARSEEMKSVLAAFRDRTGKNFNDAVYEHLQEVPHLVVRNRIRKVNHLRMGNLGDIDVLCADRNTAILWVIECKSLAMARTPYEMRQEVETLTPDARSQDSVLRKLEARVHSKPGNQDKHI